MGKQKLLIKSLIVNASIGVYEQEKKTKQNVVFDIEILLKHANLAVNDRLEEVTDYAQFRRIVLNIVKSKHYNLIEQLANDISKEFLNIKNVKKIKIRVSKPDIFDDCEVSYELIKP